jgi:hypothetical protein
MKSFFQEAQRAIGQTNRTKRASSGAAAATSSAWVDDFDAPGVGEFGSASVAGVAHPLTREWSERIGSALVREEFGKESIDSYTTRHGLNVFAGTWNTNGKAPKKDVELGEWLSKGGRDGGGADVLVIGFQEIVPLTPGKVLAVQDSGMTEMWEGLIDKALNGSNANHPSAARRGARVDEPSTSQFDGSFSPAATASTNGWVSFDEPANRVGDGGLDGFGGASTGGSKGAPAYLPVAQRQLVGVYVTVWTRASLMPHIRDVRVASVATGFNIGVGVLGNKGACGAWMRIYNTPVVFLCSHLSAGSKPGDEVRRNEDFDSIVSQMVFSPPEGYDAPEKRIEDAASVIWIGDMNYRLSLPDEFVRKALAANHHSHLLAADQLNIERAAGRAFGGWHEGEVTFPPTYKYRPGTNVYSGADDGEADDVDGAQKKEEEKKRTPAWCDRVLWKGDFDISLLEYGRVEYTHSDHKPVYATFSLFAREVVPERLNSLLFDLRRRLDHVEMSSQPKCSIFNPNVEFGVIRYAEEASASFNMTNVGDTEARFDLVSPIPGGSPTPAWLDVHPMSGSLLPGQEVVINVKACVEGSRHAGPQQRSEDDLVNTGESITPIDAILVVRLQGGRDFFVSVQGKYMQGAFGSPLEDLQVSMFPPNVPKVACTLVDYLLENHSLAPGLFRTPHSRVGTKDGLFRACQAAQSSNADLSALQVNVYDVGEALLSFFAALPTPILSGENITGIIDSIPPNEPPSVEFVRASLSAHLTPRARATLLHAATLIKRLDDDLALTGSNTDATKLISTFTIVLFKPSSEPPSRRRLAFVAALCDCRTAFLSHLPEVHPEPESGVFASTWAFFQPPPPPADDSSQSTGNLIDI